MSKVKKKRADGAASLNEMKLLDYVLNLMLGAGLEYFISDSNLYDGDQGRALVLLADRAGTGVNGAFFLATKMKVMVRFDEMHDYWNNCLNAVKHCGMWRFTPDNKLCSMSLRTFI